MGRRFDIASRNGPFCVMLAASSSGISLRLNVNVHARSCQAHGSGYAALVRPIVGRCRMPCAAGLPEPMPLREWGARQRKTAKGPVAPTVLGGGSGVASRVSGLSRDITWLGRKDSNLRMADPKSAALPLGYSPPPVPRSYPLAGGPSQPFAASGAAEWWSRPGQTMRWTRGMCSRVHRGRAEAAWRQPQLLRWRGTRPRRTGRSPSGRRSSLRRETLWSGTVRDHTPPGRAAPSSKRAG